jgi:1,4-alpha-glucan branching enzyme
MPINEVGTKNSWGYDPAFFYAVEESFGGPNALKRLVDTCHRHGIAVLLDVVFNHGGTTDNSLWPLARDTFFDGDTAWGAMINYDHPQVGYFFEQNLVYLLEEYHVDGFRFDFTRVIIHGHEPGEAHVREAGSGGGWEFLRRLRVAARQINRSCIFIAEHLPNEWGVTAAGGPMDSQWCDDFHDHLKELCAGSLHPKHMSSLADALKITHLAAGDWFRATMYAESHDEVGNENGRIANVAGFGRGWRMSKVAAAVTLMSRGIPMFFMGHESGEHRQFFNGSGEALDLDEYAANADRGRIRSWFNALLDLRSSDNIRGPSPLTVVYAQDQQLSFVRGQQGEYFTLVNFGGWSGWKSLSELNLPDGRYRELWNSTWPAFAVEGEDEHTNGGRDATLRREHWLHVPDYGVVILERI